VRWAALAAAVAHRVELLPGTGGVVLPGVPAVLVTWEQCAAALGPVPPTDPAAPAVLAHWLRLRRVVADTPSLLLADGARLVGLPVGHVLHPGPAWAVDRVRGGALDLGLGVRALDPADRSRVVLVPPSLWAAADIDPSAWLPPERARLEELGAVAAQRFQQDPSAPLRPVGDADAVTLLGSPAFRRGLVAEQGGMAAVAVPMRRRGWPRLSLLDPAFAPAAAAATEPAERGFPRALLVTADEVVLAGTGTYALRAIVDGRLPAGDTAPALRR